MGGRRTDHSDVLAAVSRLLLRARARRVHLAVDACSDREESEHRRGENTAAARGFKRGRREKEKERELCAT